VGRALEVTKAHYLTRFSLGEPLPVMTHGIADPEPPGFFLDNCAKLLASDRGASPSASARPSLASVEQCVHTVGREDALGAAVRGGDLVHGVQG
jgi:hypothetical protein